MNDKNNSELNDLFEELIKINKVYTKALVFFMSDFSDKIILDEYNQYLIEVNKEVAINSKTFLLGFFQDLANKKHLLNNIPNKSLIQLRNNLSNFVKDEIFISFLWQLDFNNYCDILLKDKPCSINKEIFDYIHSSIIGGRYTTKNVDFNFLSEEDKLNYLNLSFKKLNTISNYYDLSKNTHNTKNRSDIIKL